MRIFWGNFCQLLNGKKTLVSSSYLPHHLFLAFNSDIIGVIIVDIIGDTIGDQQGVTSLF